MKVELKDISKRYTSSWILKKVNYSFESGGVYGVRGPNGSGKSTLMQIISTQLSPTLGKIDYYNKEGIKLSDAELFRAISFSAPYIGPLENLNLDESIVFHMTFRNLKREVDMSGFVELLDFPFETDQLVKNYSSGMKQRLSLAFSILSENSLILLDEPGSYLDVQGKKWFQNLLSEYKGDSTVIISSNDAADLAQCTAYYDI